MTAPVAYAMGKPRVEARDCLAQLRSYLNIEKNTGIDRVGTSEAGECKAFIRSEYHESGISHKMTEDFSIVLFGDIKTEHGVYPVNPIVGLSDSDDLIFYRVDQCAKIGSDLVLDIRADERYGWHKRWRTQTTITMSENGGFRISTKEAELGWPFDNAFNEKQLNCSF